MSLPPHHPHPPPQPYREQHIPRGFFVIFTNSHYLDEKKKLPEGALEIKRKTPDSSIVLAQALQNIYILMSPNLALTNSNNIADIAFDIAQHAPDIRV